MVRLTNSSRMTVGTVKVGLDPEFLLFDRLGNFVSARDVFGGDTYHDEVGTDEDLATGELRPAAGSPAVVIKNTTNLLQKLSDVIKSRGLLVFAGAKSYIDDGGGYDDTNISLGGHIHFNVPYCEDFIEILDAFIGEPMLHMANSDRRGLGDYGDLSEWESKPYGFEYRTPPSFIGKPDLFAGVIAVAYCLARTWVTYKRQIGNKWEFNDTPCVADYQKLVCYKMYAKQIEGFLSYVNEGKSIEEYNVLAAWEISTDLANVSL